MVVESKFFESIDGDRVYSATQFSRSLNVLSLNGICAGVEDELEVLAGAGMSVDVQLGTGWVQGRFFRVRENPENITISDGDGNNDRIDTIVARMDRNTGVRAVVIDVVEGVPAIEPEPPLLTQNNLVYEIGLANVYVEQLETVSIVQQDIEDTRDISHHTSFDALRIYHNLPETGKARITSSIDTPQNANVIIEWGEVLFDNNNFFNLGVDNTIITINKSGLYLIQYYMRHFSGVAGDSALEVSMFLNGTEVERDQVHRSGVGGTIAQAFTRIRFLNEGDEIHLSVIARNSSGNLGATIVGTDIDPNTVVISNLAYGQGDVTDFLALEQNNN